MLSVDRGRQYLDSPEDLADWNAIEDRLLAIVRRDDLPYPRPSCHWPAPEPDTRGVWAE